MRSSILDNKNEVIYSWYFKEFKRVILYIPDITLTLLFADDWVKMQGFNFLVQNNFNTWCYGKFPIDFRNFFDNILATYPKENSHSLIYNPDKPKMLRVLLSDYCNFNCRYCKVQSNICHKKESSNINQLEEKFKYFLNKAQELPIIEFSGGEPLLEAKSLIHLTELAKNIRDDLTIVVSTNGTLLNEDLVRCFKDLDIRLLISLDGFENTHNTHRYFHNGKGTFNQVMKGIEIVKKFNVEFGLSCVVGAFNVNKIGEEMYEHCRCLQPASIGLNFLKYPSVNNKNNELQVEPKLYANAVRGQSSFQ